MTERTDIRLVHVESVDNDGQPCTICDDVDAFVHANVYLPQSGSRGKVAECCLGCVLPLVIESAPTFRVLVEVSP